MFSRSQHKAAAFFASLGLVIVTAAFTTLLFADSDASASTVFGVYLEPPDTPEEFQLNVDPALLEARQLQVVHSADALLAEVSSSHPQSIWINKTAASAIPSTWIREQSQRGVAIVGIDMTRRELATLLGVTDIGDTPDWRPDVPTFVIYYESLAVPFTNDQGEPATFGAKGWFNDAYDPENPEWLFFLVNEAIRSTHLSVPDIRLAPEDTSP